MIFGHFGGPEAHLGGPGAHFEDFGDCCDFGSASATKTLVPFGGQNGGTNLLFEDLVAM